MEREDVRFLCTCECGGSVWGVFEFGRTFSWCDRCTPVQTISASLIAPRRGIDAGSPQDQPQERRAAEV